MEFYLILIGILLFIGAVPFVCGIVMTSGVLRKNARPNPNYKTDLVIGILLIIVGASVANIPSAYDVINLAGTAQTILRDQDRLDFYNAYVETDAKVEASEESAAESGFDCNGMHYSRINDMRVSLHDPYRKEAAANLADEKKTLFRYDNQSGCDLLCLKYSVYCPDEQMDALDKFFRDGELIYVCRGNRSYAESFEASITDGYFFNIYDLDPSIVEACSVDNNQSRLILDYPTEGYTITQTSRDNELERSFCVVRGADGEVYIRDLSTLSGSDTSEAVYRVIDPSVSRFFLDLNMEVYTDD